MSEQIKEILWIVGVVICTLAFASFIAIVIVRLWF